MKGTTHLLGGLGAGLAVAPLVPHPVVMVAAATFGGLLPDWDHPRSTLGRWIPWPGVSAFQGPGLPPRWGRWGWPRPIWHRHQAHSLVGTALAAGILCLVFNAVAHWALPPAAIPWPLVALGLWVGALSHLFLDGFNQTPQWWGWPLTRRGFRWPIHAPVAVVDGVMSLFLAGWIVFWALTLRPPGWML